MKIGLNGTCFNNRPSGARQRFVGIYQRLVEKLPDEEFVVYEPADFSFTEWFGDAKNVLIRKTPISSVGRFSKFLYGLSYWHSEFKREQFAAFEGFNLPIVRASSGTNLLTVHDVRFMYSNINQAERLIYKEIFKNSLKKADHILTVSDYMKEEIITLVPNASVSVLYNGIDAQKFDILMDQELAEVRYRLSLPDNFILAVGHLEPRKNYLSLLSAVSRLDKNNFDINLVIVGNDSGMEADIKNKIMRDNLAGRVRLLTGLDDRVVRCLYKLCQLFVFISTYEGFGIPILEAMASHKPMILSDIPVFKEITRGRYVYVQPLDIDAISNAISTVLASVELQQKMVQYGDKRIADFNFEILAQQLASLYRKLK